MAADIPSFKLNTGYMMPSVGMGCVFTFWAGNTTPTDPVKRSARAADKIWAIVNSITFSSTDAGWDRRVKGRK